MVTFLSLRWNLPKRAGANVFLDTAANNVDGREYSRKLDEKGRHFRIVTEYRAFCGAFLCAMHSFDAAPLTGHAFQNASEVRKSGTVTRVGEEAWMRNRKGFYTLREVCELTRLSKTTIYRMRKSREFPGPARRTPGVMRFNVGEVDDWLDGRWRPPDGEPPLTPPEDDDGQSPDDSDR